MRPTHTHLAFADESNWNTGRFRSLAAISGPARSIVGLDKRLRAIDESHRLTSEIKWSQLTSDRRRDAAYQYLMQTALRAQVSDLRVDVLTWDTYDARHTIERRDDASNLERMYHHLLVHVMGRRFERSRGWKVYVDEHESIDITELGAIVTRAGWAKGFDVASVDACNSAHWRPIQAADLFAGAACLAAQHSVHLQQVRAERRIAKSMRASWDRELAIPHLSASTRRRLLMFDDVLDRVGVRISFAPCGRLRTQRGARVNFWPYQPQHELDRAPTRSTRASRRRVS